MTSIVECSYCGNGLEGEALESPLIDPDDQTPVCDDCYHDHFEFTCCGCEEYGDIEDQHKYLVVFEAVDDVEPGIYHIKDLPYFTSGMIGSSWLHAWALKKVKDLPVRWLAYVSITGRDVFRELTSGEQSDGYSCGHLCADCQKGIFGGTGNTD